jgi:hypothetical protein
MAMRMVMTVVMVVRMLAMAMRMAGLVVMRMCVIVVVHTADYRALGSDRRAVFADAISAGPITCLAFDAGYARMPRKYLQEYA